MQALAIGSCKKPSRGGAKSLDGGLKYTVGTVLDSRLKCLHSLCLKEAGSQQIRQR